MLPLPKPYIISDKVDDEFLYPRSKHYPPTESWELGGVALSDPSEPLTKYIWHAWIDKKDIYVKRADLADDTAQVIVSDNRISEVDLTFDQNMRPCISFVANNVAKLYWYNAETESYNITSFGNVKNPRVSLDDKRRFNVADSDIIFAYLRDDKLYCRIQRDRYSKEYELATIDNPKHRLLWRIGMGVKNRFLFYVR